MATRRAVLGGGLVGRGKGPCSLALSLCPTPALNPAACRALFNTTATAAAPTTKNITTPSPRACAVPVPRRPGTSWPARPGLGLRLRRPYSSGADAAGQKEGEGQRAPSGSRIWSFEEIDELTREQQKQQQQQTGNGRRRVTIIDVREPGEVAQTGRIPGAVNVPVTSAPDSFHLSAEDFEDRFGFERPGLGLAMEEDAGEEQEQEQVLFYCKAGVRSRAAAALARDAGWNAVVGEYPGSWVDWVARGGKVER